MTKRTLLLTLSAAALTLTIAACGGSPEEGATSSTTAAEPSAESTTESTTEPAPSATESASTSDTGDVTASALAAIDAAEAEAAGTATSIDDVTGGGWEVDVATDATLVEVVIGPDGAVTGTQDEPLEADDAAEVAAASVTLAEAIQTALDSAGGTFRDADLSEDGGVVSYEVSLLVDDVETDVHIDAASGEVLSTTTDD